MSEVSVTPIRVCSRCGVTKPLTPQFYHRKNVGRETWKFQFQCKVCRNLGNKDYHAKDPERQQRYYRNTIDLRRAYNRAYYEANRERIQAQVAAYREANAEKTRAAVRRWNRQNKEAKGEHHRRRRANTVAAEGTHSAAEVWTLAEAQEWLCAYCETPLFGEYHVDHMQPLSRGGSDDWSNLAISCAKCNLSKGNKTAEEFVNARPQARQHPEIKKQGV